jgi:hypothetical protein
MGAITFNPNEIIAMLKTVYSSNYNSVRLYFRFVIRKLIPFIKMCTLTGFSEYVSTP